MPTAAVPGCSSRRPGARSEIAQVPVIALALASTAPLRRPHARSVASRRGHRRQPSRAPSAATHRRLQAGRESRPDHARVAEDQPREQLLQRAPARLQRRRRLRRLLRRQRMDRAARRRRRLHDPRLPDAQRRPPQRARRLHADGRHHGPGGGPRAHDATPRCRGRRITPPGRCRASRSVQPRARAASWWSARTPGAGRSPSRSRTAARARSSSRTGEPPATT